MKSIVIFFLLIIYSANLNSGILKMDVAGTFKTTVIKLLDNSSFITYFSKSTIITNVDVYASAECNGIVERKEVESKNGIYRAKNHSSLANSLWPIMPLGIVG